MKFDTDFENEIIAQCLRDKDYLRSAHTLIEAHHFATEEHSWVWKLIHETWDEHAELVSPSKLRAVADRDFSDDDERVAHLGLALKLLKLKPTAPRAALDELQKFVSFVKLQAAGEEMARYMEKGNIGKAYEAIRPVVLQEFRPAGYKVSHWMEEFGERLKVQKHKRDHPEAYPCVATKIRPLDNIIDGLRASELGLIMATTGRGKSIMSVHLGYAAMLQGVGVIHFSFEMPVDQVAMRYDSRFTGFLHRKFKLFDFSERELKAMASRIRKMKERMRRRLKIISFPIGSATLPMCRRAATEVMDSLDDFGLMIFDSGDHLKATVHYNDIRHEHASNYWGLKGLAEEEGIPVWSTVHAGKGAAKRVATSEDSAESYDKSRIADLVMSLNRKSDKSRATPKVDIGEDDDSKAEKELESARVVGVGVSDIVLFLTKYRDGESDIKIPLDTDLKRMLIKAKVEEAA